MRLVRFIVVVAMMSGCSAAPRKPHDNLDYARVLDELLKQRPDDPDLLFLRHDDKDLALCNRLAELRPTPVVLASVVCRHISAGVDESELPDLEKPLAVWLHCDPDNAVPVLLKGLVQISRGNLSGGLETVIRSSKLARLQLYTLEAKRETLRIHNRERMTDMVSVEAVTGRGNSDLAKTVWGGSKLLRAVATWRFLQGDRAEARRLAEADHRLAFLLGEGATDVLEGMILSCMAPSSADRLSELALMRGDSVAAAKYAEQSREAWVASEGRSLAGKRQSQADPRIQLMREAGLLPLAPKRGETDDPLDALSNLIDTLAQYFTAWSENKGRYYELLNQKESVIRPHLEAEAVRGSLAVEAERLTEADRQALRAMSAPVDKFMSMVDTFYPASFGREQRNRLIAILTADWSDDDIDLQQFLQGKAANALIFHKDSDALPTLRRLMEDDDLKFDRTLVAVVMVALGESDELVRENLKGTVGAYNTAGAWAVAQLKMTNFIPEFVQTLRLDSRPDSIDDSFEEPVTAYLALQALTGQQFGFDGERWEEWAKKEGHLKSED